MSVRQRVYFNKDVLPLFSELIQSVSKIDPQLELEVFDTISHTGFVPARLEGKDCGFEYYFQPITNENTDVGNSKLQSAIGPRTHFVEIITHSSMLELRSAEIVAAAITQLTDGIYDGDDGIFLSRNEVAKITSQTQDVIAAMKLRRAQKDAGITERRCPNCGNPCPSYRKTCKACGKVQ